MANPGVGNRFASVNLNKSYGQSSHPNQPHGGSYGSGRGRSVGGGGGGGGMVVLSRPRSSHKVGPKLSVPPPLNLPSLRKEHEKFDTLGSGSGTAGGGAAGGGARPSSSGMGWSKPTAVVVGEKDGVGRGDRPLSSDGVDPGVLAVDGVNRGSATAYMPPSVRSGISGPDVSVVLPMEKATVLRGEDFPSLRATLTAVNGTVQKQKDHPSHQKQRQGMSEETAGGQREGSRLSSHIDMRPQFQSSQHSVGNSSGGNGSGNHHSVNSRSLDQGRKQDDYFPGPLPLVRLNPRSDWADDERDTSHAFTERGRDHGYSRTEAYWDRDFDFPRSNFLPHKPAPNHFDRRGQRDNDVGKVLSNEVSNADPFSRDGRAPSREGRERHSWRTPVSKDGFNSQEVVSDRNSMGARPISLSRETTKDNKFIPPQIGGNTRDEHNIGLAASRDFAAGRRDPGYVQRDPGYVQGGRQQWNNSADLNNGRGAERDRYGSESNRYKADNVQSSMGSRPSFSTGSKGLSGSDFSNFGREKRSFSRGEKPYVEDPFMKDWGSTGFDGQDPFSGGILGVVKRKKDVNKQLDFHDPVRESFEAELERVQRMQEQERQRIIDEQERAMEMARREEEERQRLAREQEEHQRRLEDEAREAAWRLEQEKLEAMRKAEEQRIAREEERQRLLMEEERRKQAAKQKLLELEERIARRQAESTKAESSAVQGDIMAGMVKERDAARADEFTGWEDGERMVERITNTASSDSSLRRPFDVGSRPVREGPFAFTDRGKPFNSWRRDVFDGDSSSFFSADHESGHESPRRDASAGGRGFPRKDFYGGAGYTPRGYYRGGITEPPMDDFPHGRGHRWNVSGDGDPYGRNSELETDFHENVTDRFDVGWGHGRGRGNSPFTERLYQNSELDELYTYGRSRYPARQPRVLPPPSLPLMHRSSFRNESEHAGSSAYEDRNTQFNQTIRSEPTAGSYQNVHEEQSDGLDIQEQSAKSGDQELERSISPGCDSQSSLSVSSPPSSPTHLSHDDLDESRDSLTVSGTTEGQVISHSENEAILLNAQDQKGGTLTTASSLSVGDDEEWTVENNEGLQEQEEYDEDADYHEEDEVLEGDDENVELNREFQDMHLEGKGSPRISDNMVLGFDQGVEVGMPNDEYEASPRIDGSLFAGPHVTVGVMEQKESFDGSTDGQSLQVTDVPQHVSTDSSSVTVQETGKTVQDYVSDPINASHSSASLDPLNSGDSSSGTVLPAQQSVPSPVGATSQSASGAGVQGAAEFPVKLQFGLFSGPSLIPSPVPAIQIGSIQMPLQLHPQIGPSLTHMHASQPPLFQFGQLRYPSPISQGILPLGPPSVSFVQPNVSPSYPSSQIRGGSPSVQPVQDSSAQGSVKDNALPLMGNNHHVQPPNQFHMRQDTEREATAMAGKGGGSGVVLHQNQAAASAAPMDQVRHESGHQVETEGRRYNVIRNSKPLLNNRASESRTQGGPSSSHSAANPRDACGPAVQGQLSGSRGRRFAFTARNPGSRVSSANEASRTDTNGFQRRPRRGMQRFEFRVRQVTDGKQSSALMSSSNTGSDAKSNLDGKGSGTQPRSGLKKDYPSDKPKQAAADSEISISNQLVIQKSGTGIGEDNSARKETSASKVDTSRRAEGSLKRNIGTEDDVDAPLQSGIVRVFKQPGIEAPSDEDDFIEVRSKRQMLNDRREQREKEIKAKSSNMKKSQRKSRPTPQGVASVRNTNRTPGSSSVQAAKSIHAAVTPKRGLVGSEASAAFNNVLSQTLAPIGTPSINAESHADTRSQSIKEPQTSSYSTSGQTVESDLTFDAPNKVIDGVHPSVGSWDNSRVNQPVMALTQTQLEEAMKPVQFDKHIVSGGDQTSSVSESNMPSSSALVKDSPFSSATSPISSLLAGEKIQFGAVTSPTILPSSTRVVSHSIGPPASSQLNIQISRSMPASGNECSHLFDKEKQSNASCPSLEDCEAEAEAAASAVAVAAIGNDEMVGNGIGGCSASLSDPKGFGGAALDGMTAGMSCEPQSVSRSKAEETLSVSLPADLSVETPPMSLWPPLPSPHNSSSQMLSPFPGGPASHFPFYDMNPMMGGPVFAFGPHDESAVPQSQPQKSTVPTSGPLGSWQQCHTGVDSFYGPPAGFTAPFISPPGSIPGVQGPPHMVVYNHFAPVGQYGQVGLSYMGTTYIPSGKQPDWKHNATSSPMVGSEVEMNNLNMVPVQRNAPNVPGQVQHLAPGSPLLSMASPLAMFEVSPFQNSPDPSVHPRWSHVQASSVHSIPQSMPLQQQADGAGSAQFGPGSTDHLPLTTNGFPKPQTSSSVEDGHSFTVGTNSTVSQFPDELGLVDPPGSAGSEALTLNAGGKSRPGSTAADSGRVDAVVPEGSSSRRNPQVVSASHKAQSAQLKNPPGQAQYNHYQRGATQKNGSGAEWSNRKMGFHGRNHSSGGERGFPPTKVKQIYVAKQSSGGSSNVS